VRSITNPSGVCRCVGLCVAPEDIAFIYTVTETQRGVRPYSGPLAAGMAYTCAVAAYGTIYGDDSITSRGGASGDASPW
jgi:hypothetical protein